jgi:pSer/pThr/pTyr-binding forkhead associated (FHA) protein
MEPHLEITRTAGDRILFPLTGTRVTAGKAGGCAIELDDPAVSRLHAAFEDYGDGAWVVRDLGSRNGTFVNGERLSGERALRPGDEVRVGSTRLVFKSVSSERTATTATAQPPQLTPRERDVLVELCRPMLSGDVFREPASAREIAAALVVTEDAAKQHLRNLYRKFGIDEGERRRRVALANEAFRRGAVGPNDLRS